MRMNFSRSFVISKESQNIFCAGLLTARQNTTDFFNKYFWAVLSFWRNLRTYFARGCLQQDKMPPNSFKTNKMTCATKQVFIEIAFKNHLFLINFFTIVFNCS